jgi:hypothetical protein
MAYDDRTDLTISDVALRLKEAFEDKNASALMSVFVPDAVINVEGRLHSVGELREFLPAFFTAVDQTYLDIVAVERIEKHDTRPFVVYQMDVAWVDREAWKESVHHYRVALDLEREKESRRHLIRGLTVQPRHHRDEPKDPSPGGPGFPGETRPPAPLSDPFSIWY